MKNSEAVSKKLLENPLIQNLREDNPELTDDDMRIHMNRLYQYVSENQNCSQCPGLERCPNDFAGHRTQIMIDTDQNKNQITDAKVACNLFINKQHQDGIRRRIHSFYVDEKALKQGFSLNEILGKDRSRSKAVNQLMKYIKRTKDSGLQTDGLYLSGELGTGKTFLMCYMLYEFAKIGLTGAIVYMPDFIEELKSMFSEPHKMKETVDILKQTDLLIFDDIGAENLNPWARDHIMGAILNYRMNRKPTFYTSNYDLDGLEKHFSFTNKDGDEEYKGLRIMDRIRPFVEVILINGENKRGIDKTK